MLKSKCRLIADKINKYERKGLSEVVQIYQGYEESDFWQLLGGMPDKVTHSRKLNELAIKCVDNCMRPVQCHLSYSTHVVLDACRFRCMPFSMNVIDIDSAADL